MTKISFVIHFPRPADINKKINKASADFAKRRESAGHPFCEISGRVEEPVD
jgi:hypothetical protein